MSHKNNLLLSVAILSAIISMVLFFTMQTTAWAATNAKGCTSEQCHPTMQKNAKTHPIDKQCIQCHKTNKSKHPDKETVNFSIPEHPCNGCHPKILDHDYLHPPVAANDCLKCHLVHGNKRNNYVHEQKTIICYNCHKDVIISGKTVLHGEISDNKCSSCHTTHGSSFPRLLRGSYSLNFFNDYTDKAYQFCFRCHKKDLLIHPRTSYNTKFRDGKKNLHFKHVNKKNKGHSCATCHRTHASTLPHLIAQTVTFGEWQLPINFVPNKNGGKCSPGCHATRSYDRSLVKKRNSSPGLEK